MGEEQQLQNIHMAKGQIRLIERAEKNCFAKEQINYLNRSAMPVNICDVYFRYFKLCNTLNIPTQKSLLALNLNKENHSMLTKDNLKYFIGRNLLDDIILDEKMKKCSCWKNINGAKNISEQLKKKGIGGAERNYLGLLCHTGAGEVLWEFVGDNKGIYDVFLEKIIELVKVIEEKYSITFNEVCSYLKIMPRVLYQKCIYNNADIKQEVIEKLQKLYTYSVNEEDAECRSTEYMELWDDLMVIHEYICPANWKFTYGYDIYYSEKAFIYPVFDISILNSNVTDLSKIYPNYKIDEDCLCKITEIIKNTIITEKSNQSCSKTQKVNKEVLECIINDARMKTPAKPLKFNVNTQYEPLTLAKAFMKVLETSASSLFCQCNEKDATMQPHIFSTEYKSYKVQVNNRTGYEYVSFHIGNSIIKLKKTLEGTAAVVVSSINGIEQHNFIFNTKTGNLFIEYKGKKGKWYPATVKALARIFRYFSSPEYASVLEYYRMFIAAVMQWHREKGNMIVNEVEGYIYDGLFLPPVNFNEIITYKSFKEAFSKKYEAPRNWSWNTTNVNIMYAAYNIAKYIQPMDKSRVYDIVAELYNKYIVDNNMKERFNCSYVKRNNINLGVMRFLELFYFDKFVYNQNCYECGRNTEENQMYISDYIKMSIQTKTPISLRITSVKKIKEKHNQIQMNIVIRKTPKLVIPKKSKFRHLRELLPADFEYITTRERLVEETVKQNHCVAAYADKINADKIAIYSFIHPDKKKRYTVEFVANKNESSKEIRYKIAQVAGCNNSEWNDKEIIQYIEQYI